MQDNTRYAVGIDVGTSVVRCVVGHLDASTGQPTIVGVGEVKNTGMRKGTVVNLNGPAKAMDDALLEAERMSGYEVHSASVGVNGSHILSTNTDGMIAVGSADHQVTLGDIDRIIEVATVGKVPANRDTLDVVPHSYRLDGQDGIKDPVGMTGTRLEINANVVSAMVPQMNALKSVLEKVNIEPTNILPSVMAAAKSVLSEQQVENGVAVIDLGASTTGIAVYEEGDLQYVSVLPVGGNNITNDLAIGLKTDPEIAEEVKLTHGSAVQSTGDEKIIIKHEKETFEFGRSDMDEIIDARLEEIFDSIKKELKKSGLGMKLPGGVVLTGGGAKLKGVVEFTKDRLGVAARIGSPDGFSGVAEHANEPQYATAIGLMLIDSVGSAVATKKGRAAVDAKEAAHQAGGLLKNLFKKFRA